LHRAWGPRIAGWAGDPVMTVALDKELVTKPLPDQVEFALPLSSSRMLIANRQTLSLRDQSSARWTISTANLGAVIDAMLVFDGKAVALCTRSSAGKAIVVVGMRDGALLHR